MINLAFLMIRCCAAIVYLFLTCLSLHAQENIINCTDSTFCIPGVIGLPRSKGIVIHRELVRDYRIRSNSNSSLGNSEAEVIRNRRWNIKVRAPIIMKKNFKMAAGIRYFVEEFNFENPANIDYSFYENLEDRSLRRIRGDIFMIKPSRTNKYFILRLSAGLNGDYNASGFANSEFLKFTISPFIGWKKNEYVSYAFGLAFSNSFGKRAIYPIVAYNKSFNSQWGVESILPVEAKLRYSTINQKNYFYLKSQLYGSNYNIQLNDLQNDLVILDKSEVRFLLTWEREIHDWLWFGITAGIRNNINFDLSNSPNKNADIIVDNSLNTALIYSMSIFAVPPRKLLK